MLADAAFPRSPPGNEGTNRRVDAGGPFPEASPGDEREPIGVPPPVHRAGEGLQEKLAEDAVIVTHTPTQIGDRHEDRLPSLRSNLRRPKTEGFDLTGGEALEHDIGLTNEIAHESQPFRRCHIGHDAPLRRVEPFEEGACSGWFIT